MWKYLHAMQNVICKVSSKSLSQVYLIKYQNLRQTILQVLTWVRLFACEFERQRRTAWNIWNVEIDKVTFATWHVNFEFFRAAGPLLLEECRTLDGCPTGQAKITCGYRLPAKFVIATAGPMGEHPDELQSCYENCLKVMKENNLRSIVSFIHF